MRTPFMVHQIDLNRTLKWVSAETISFSKQKYDSNN